MGVEYDGSAYHGWQYQSHDPLTIQAYVQKALTVVANEPVSVICAGRTDAGVHASQQIIHFDCHAQRRERAWVMGSNSNLPPDISVRWARPVEDAFHARYSAIARTYRYVIYNHPVRPAHLFRQMSWDYRPLDMDRMQRAAEDLVGEHNFNAYRASGCQAHNPVRQVHWIRLHRVANLLILDIKANGFLHHMVRNIVGVLSDIGAGSQCTSWARRVLDSQDRTQGGVTASPNGLYFVGVDYPEQFQIPRAHWWIPSLPLADVNANRESEPLERLPIDDIDGVHSWKEWRGSKS